MKQILLTLIVSVLAAFTSQAQVLVSYWAFNDYLVGTSTNTFGFEPGDFDMNPNIGSGTLKLGTLSTTTTNLPAGTSYSTVQSFAGDLLNAQTGYAAGGSFSVQPGTGNINNGTYFDINVSLFGLNDPVLSFAARGTTTGFDSRKFSYSTDGLNFTDFATDSGDLPSTWVLKSYDFSTADALDNQASVTFRVTLDGGTSATGNNRFDNLTITAVPEPSSSLLLMVGAAGLIGIRALRRKNS